MKESWVQKSPTLRQHASQELAEAIDDFIARRKRSSFTCDATGTFHAIEAYISSFEMVVRNHPLVGTMKIRFSDLHADNIHAAVQKMAAKRARVSPFDIKCVKAVILLFQEQGLPVEGLKEVLRGVTKRAIVRSRPHIRRSAKEYRRLLLHDAMEGKREKGIHALELARNRAIIALLLTSSPLRIGTLRNLKLIHLDPESSTLTIPPDCVKNRIEITFKLPAPAIIAFSRYMELRTKPCQYLFATSKEKQLSRNGLYRALVKRSKAVLGLAISPHLYRHIQATLSSLLVSEETAAQLLQVSLTVLREHYILSSSEQRLGVAINRMNEALKDE